jgi:hypothetical protein
MQRLKIASLISVAAAAMALAIPAAASASVTSTASSISSSTTTPDMQLVKAVAVEGQGNPGYTNVLLSNGATVSLPSADASSLQDALNAQASSGSSNAVTPDLTGSITGSCGTSYITLETKSNGDPIRRISGFNINSGAVYYYWQYTISGPSYPSYTQTDSGYLADRLSWDTDISSSSNYPHGTWHAAVSTSSYAELSDLISFCYSLGPNINGTV